MAVKTINQTLIIRGHVEKKDVAFILPLRRKKDEKDYIGISVTISTHSMW